MIDPALRRLLVLAVRHPYAMVAQWSALGLTDEETAALLPDDVATAIAGLTNGASIDLVASRVPTLAPLLRWVSMPWPDGCHPAPVEGEVDALVETYARRQVAIIADAIDLMSDGLSADQLAQLGSETPTCDNAVWGVIPLPVAMAHAELTARWAAIAP